MMKEAKRLVAMLDVAIQQESAARGMRLAKGQCSDHAEYRNHCGIITGLGLAQSFARDLLHKLDMDEVMEEEKKEGGNGQGVQTMPDV